MAIAVLTRVPVEAYASALAPLGIEVVAMPVTRQGANTAEIRATARALLGGPYAATVVASARAARLLRTAAVVTTAIARDENVNRQFAVAELGEIWAVGPATLHDLERDARVDGTRPDVAGEPWPARHPDGVHTAAELARAMLASRSFVGARVLVPRADEGRTDAIEMLRAAGADVVDVIAYRTTPMLAGAAEVIAGRDALRAGGAAYCSVFAPSQVTALAGIVGELPALRTQFVAIGETTAAALRAAGVEPLVAATPTPEGLAQAIALHLRPA